MHLLCLSQRSRWGRARGSIMIVKELYKPTNCQSRVESASATGASRATLYRQRGGVSFRLVKARCAPRTNAKTAEALGCAIGCGMLFGGYVVCATRLVEALFFWAGFLLPRPLRLRGLVWRQGCRNVLDGGFPTRLDGFVRATEVCVLWQDAERALDTALL